MLRIVPCNITLNSTVDSFATYAYSCRICLLQFFIVFKAKNKKKFLVCKCDSYTRMLRMNPPLISQTGAMLSLTSEHICKFNKFDFLF